METPGGTGDSAGSSAGGASDFGKLLLSGDFSEGNREDYPLTVCVSWLRLRRHQVSMWERDFRQHQSELLKALVDIREDLANLYNRMDRLCEGENCYLYLTLSTLPPAVQDYYGEFLTAYDHISRVLRRYVAYAHHYETNYEKGEMPEDEPEDLQEKLFENFDLLKEALRNLAEELAPLVAQSADPGQDTPGGPDRRSA